MRCQCGHEQDAGRFCGRCGALLDTAREDLDRGDGSLRAPQAPSRSRARFAAVVAVLVGIVAVVVALVHAPAPDVTGAPVALPSPAASDQLLPADDDPGPAGQWPSGFLTPTDSALVFDDGHSGAVALDLDTGWSRTLRLPQRPGDQPFRIRRLGDRVVVGWGEIHAVHLAPDGVSRHLADATLFVPAADPERLWLIDWDGGRIGLGEVTWTLVDETGATLHAVTPDHGDVEVLRGVPGGLAVRDATGHVVTYDLATGRLLPLPSEDALALLDVAREHVVWCADPCRDLVVSDREGAVISSVGGEHVRHVDGSWIAPDGGVLVTAMMTELSDGAVDRRLVVHRTDTGAVVADTALPLGAVHGSWSADGEQFFWSLASAQGPQQLGRWRAGFGIEQVDVRPHLDGLGDFVVLPADEVAIRRQLPR